MNAKTSQYKLSTGKTDEQRLNVLNEIYNPPTKQLLLDAGTSQEEIDTLHTGLQQFANDANSYAAYSDCILVEGEK